MARRRVLFSNSTRTNSVIASLSNIQDKVEIISSENLREGLQISIDRKVYYSRVIFTRVALNELDPEDDIKFLRQYLENYCPTTEVVFLVKESDPEDTISLFESELSSPIYTVAKLIGVPDVQTLEECFESPVPNVRAKYNLTSNFPDVSAPQVKVKPKKEKKPGFLSKLFGGGKSKKGVVAESGTSSKEPVSGSEEVALPTLSPESEEDEVLPEAVLPELDVATEPWDGSAASGLREISYSSDELDSLLNLTPQPTQSSGLSLDGFVGTTFEDEDLIDPLTSSGSGYHGASSENFAENAFTSSGVGVVDNFGSASVVKSPELPEEFTYSLSTLVSPLVVFGTGIFGMLADLSERLSGITIVDNTASQGMQWYAESLPSSVKLLSNTEHHDMQVPNRSIILEDISSAEKYRGSSVSTVVLIGSSLDVMANDLLQLNRYDYTLSSQLAGGDFYLLGSRGNFLSLTKNALFSSYNWKGLVE